MTPSADQVAAFQANGGFEPSAVAAVVLGFVFAVLLLWGVANAECNNTESFLSEEIM